VGLQPINDLKAAQRLVSGASGFTADVIVMGKDAADAFEANANVMEGYNKLFIQQGTLNPSAVTVGVTALGTWRGIPLYASEEQYEDSDGTMKYYVPPKEVLVAASGIQSTMAYAAVAQVNSEGTGMEPIEGRRIPLVFWDTSGEDYRRFRLSSRPTGQDLERGDEVVAQRCSIRSHGRRESSPEDSISGIEKNNFVRIVLSQSLGPLYGRGGNVLLRPGRGDGCSHEQAASEYYQQNRSQSPESHAPFSSSIKTIIISSRAVKSTARGASIVK
jgi:hypothetical protein